MINKLYILPFDHRGSFMKLIKAEKPPTEENINKAKEYKKIIYEAFQKAVSSGVAKEYAGILVDEWLGKDILLDAHAKGFQTCTPLEKSGQKEFDFDRTDYRKQIEELNPTYVKVLVRYNIEDDAETNKRQTERLAELSKYLADKDNGYLFELLVPGTEDQLKNGKDNFEHNLRPDLMIKAIKELQDAGVNPDIWKLEGLDTTEAMQKVADQVKAGNENAGIIILGRGESKEKAKHWLSVGAKVNGAIGFAVGRTIFKLALEDYDSGKINRDEALNQIAENYSFFVDVWEKAS